MEMGLDLLVTNDMDILRASFGTTKYCTYFLRNAPCNNTDCMYLHDLGEEEDSFTKEDIAQGFVAFLRVLDRFSEGWWDYLLMCAVFFLQQTPLP
jgi:hypothetical protein